MKVSVIIPVYNVALYVERCLLSVLNQTWQDMEVLVVNDCTPDNSMEIVRRVVVGHPRGTMVRVLEHEVNKGQSAARNTAIRVATGDYLYILDSDDFLPLDSIEKLVGMAIRYQVDFVTSRHQDVESDRLGGIYPRSFPGLCETNEQVFLGYLKGRWDVLCGNKLIKRDVITKYNLYFKEGIIHEDDLWTFQLACCAKSLYISDAVSYYYVKHPGSTTTAPSMRNLECRVIVLGCIFDLISTNPSLRSNRLVYIFFETLKAKYFDYILYNSSDETFRFGCYRTFRAKKYLSAWKALFRFRIGVSLALRNLHYALPVRAGYVYFKLYVKLTYYILVLPSKLKSWFFR